MKNRPKLLHTLLLIFVALLVIVALTLLWMWTSYIKKSHELEALRSAMSSVVEKNGEKALFEMAGIPVDAIYYGRDGLSLYEGERGSWSYTTEEARKIAVYSKCRDSVVQIQNTQELSESGQGSGVIITSDGYIVTNKHVIGGSEVFNVNFSDDSTMTARLIGFDELTDIALIKVDGRRDLPYITFSPSSSLVVGQSVMAIGNPYGYTWSFTSGLVSGLERMVFTASGSVIPNMIQTDAMINPGNSGGPLLDGRGTMVGLISSIYSTSGAAQGISFALPSESVESVVKELLEHGSVSRGWLDILSVQLNPQIVSYLSLPINEGILISQVVPAGMADRGGLKGGNERAQYGQSVIYLGGDIITEINGQKISDYTDYFSALFSTKAGDKADITVFRNGSFVNLKSVELVKQNEENIRWILR